MLKGRLFKRTKEDFECEQCGASVQGNGFTNHCPQCLWSKHVDINPGDRESLCKGLMRPTGSEKKSETYYITHTCTQCGFVRKNKLQKNDSFDSLLNISKEQSLS